MIFQHSKHKVRIGGLPFGKVDLTGSEGNYRAVGQYGVTHLSPEMSEALFVPPENGSAKIWRHMNLSKLESMLENQGLFFSRLDKFEDRFEGSITSADEKALRKKYCATVIRAAQFHVEEYMRKRFFVSCWHVSGYESIAMWQLYGKAGESVAIQSTYPRLRNWLDTDIRVGRIKYLDYRTDKIPEAPFYWRVMSKRKSFEHERELRAVYIDDISESPLPPGIWRKGNLNDLIEAIYVAPNAPAWVRETVSDLAARYSVTATVRNSYLDDDPIY